MNKILNTINKIRLYTLILLFCTYNVAAIDIKTTIDRNPISINESFQITYTAAQSPDGEPDFSPLKNNFDILNQSQRSNSSWINGQSSKTIQWILNVMAKQEGKLSIPAISFGVDKSQPTSILVTKHSTPNNKTNEDIFLKVEATPARPYVQSQILYTVRFFRRVEIARASLNEPEMDDAIIEKLGDDKNYNTKIRGVAYFVTERKYAIFPQKSGVSTISPLSLTAEVVSNSRARFNGFFNRQITKTKQIKSRTITLDVQPAPEDFKGTRWIPAEQVYIKEEWSGDTDKMKIGEPLTRTLSLLAKGTLVAQIPELHIKTEIAQLKTYPDQPALDEQKGTDGLFASRKEKIAFIPSKAGKYKLPTIKIPWFNTKTQKMEMAHLPEKIIVAIPSIAQTVAPLVQTLTQNNTKEPEIIVQQIENKLWKWVSFVLAFAWLTTLVFFFRKRKPTPQELPINSKEISLKETVKALKLACKEDNKSAANEALLAWGKIKFNSSNLSSIASHCEARLRDEILLLNQNLYANQTQQWQGKKLFQYFTENSAREKVAKNTHDGLEPLYKIV